MTSPGAGRSRRRGRASRSASSLERDDFFARRRRGRRVLRLRGGEPRLELVDATTQRDVLSRAAAAAAALAAVSAAAVSRRSSFLRPRARSAPEPPWSRGARRTPPSRRGRLARRRPTPPSPRARAAPRFLPRRLFPRLRILLEGGCDQRDQRLAGARGGDFRGEAREGARRDSRGASAPWRLRARAASPSPSPHASPRATRSLRAAASPRARPRGSASRRQPAPFFARGAPRAAAFASANSSPVRAAAAASAARDSRSATRARSASFSRPSWKPRPRRLRSRRHRVVPRPAAAHCARGVAGVARGSGRRSRRRSRPRRRGRACRFWNHIAFVLTEAFSGATAGEGPSLGALAVDSGRPFAPPSHPTSRGTAGSSFASGFPRRAPGLGELSLRRVVAPALLHKRRGDRLELGYRLLPRRLRLARGGHEPRHLRLGRVCVRAVQRGGRRRHLGGGLRRRLGARRAGAISASASADRASTSPFRLRATESAFSRDASAAATRASARRCARPAPRTPRALLGARSARCLAPPGPARTAAAPLDLLLRFRARIRGILPRARHRLVRTARRRVFGACARSRASSMRSARARAVAHGALRRGAALRHLAVAAVAHQTQLVCHPPALRRRGLRAASVRVSLGARALDVRAHLREHARVFLPARRSAAISSFTFSSSDPRGALAAAAPPAPPPPWRRPPLVRRGLVRRGRRGVEPARRRSISCSAARSTRRLRGAPEIAADCDLCAATSASSAAVASRSAASSLGRGGASHERRVIQLRVLELPSTDSAVSAATLVASATASSAARAVSRSPRARASRLSSPARRCASSTRR